MSARKNMAGIRGARAVLGLLAAFLFVALAGCLSPKPAYAGDSGGAATGDEQVTINIKVVWEDPLNEGVTPPESVRVVVRSTEEFVTAPLIDDGSVKEAEADVSAATDWKASFTLPFWKEGGDGQNRVPANYYIEQEEFNWDKEGWYQTSYTKDNGWKRYEVSNQVLELDDPAADSVQGFTIHNTYFSGNRASFEFGVDWKDEGYEDQRPSSVTVRLLGNGVEVDSFTLSAENNWIGGCNPRVVDAEGNKIKYEFVEDEIEGYEISYSDNNGGQPNSPDGEAASYVCNIINTRKEPEPEPEPEPEAPKPEAPKPETPKPAPAPEPAKSATANPKVLVQTGDVTSAAIPVLMVVVAVSAIVAGVAKRMSMDAEDKH